jgi:benzylsuccinate CoA-transferase BbsE subunit
MFSQRSIPSIRQTDAVAGIRVLDAAGPAGSYCGKLFADMGADVILVEPPGGHALRREFPFIDDVEDPERSIPFAYYHTSKRGISLELDRSEGQELFRCLARTANLVIETEMPGVMNSRGLSPANLARTAPHLVVTSITPFGQTGPYSRFLGEDLTALAMGGFLYISGYPDMAPTRLHGNQAFLTASMFSAVASMVAVMDAEQSGQGEHIDVSIQEAVAMALENSVPFYDLEGHVRKRTGLTQRYTGAGLFPCSDGYVYVFVGGLAAIRFWDGFVQWMKEERVEGASRLDGPQWHNRAFRDTEQARTIFAEVFAPFALLRKQMDLYLAAQARRIPMSPVSTGEAVANNPQLQARGFFVDVGHPAADRTLRMPGAPYLLSRTPWHIQRPAPRLGEHNEEVFAEIGLSPAELATLQRKKVI